MLLGAPEVNNRAPSASPLGSNLSEVVSLALHQLPPFPYPTSGANHRQPRAMGGQHYRATNNVDVTVDLILPGVLVETVGARSFVVESSRTPSTPVLDPVQ